MELNDDINFLINNKEPVRIHISDINNGEQLFHYFVSLLGRLCLHISCTSRINIDKLSPKQLDKILNVFRLIHIKVQVQTKLTFKKSESWVTITGDKSNCESYTLNLINKRDHHMIKFLFIE